MESSSEILRLIVGSKSFGTDLPGVSDTDIMAIYIEPPEQVIGLAQSRASFATRSLPVGWRSGPHDVEVQHYSLRKFVALAIAGNPSIIAPLFSGKDLILHQDWAGWALMAMREHFLSRHVPFRFLGYLEGQLARLRGDRFGMPKRPELIEAHGYDTKFASTALRVGLQGVELARSHTLAMPMTPENRAYVLHIKTGSASFPEAMEKIIEVRDLLAVEAEHCRLPPEVDRELWNTWLASVHQQMWGYQPRVDGGA